MKHLSRLMLSVLPVLMIAAFGPSADAREGLQTFAIVGDGGLVTEEHLLVRRSIERSGVADLILPGDNLYKTRQGYGSVWNAWRERGFRFPIVAIGNHNAGYREEIKYFGMPDEAYSYVNKDARFIVLNSDNKMSVAPQLRFLIRELESARERFVFVVYHHPTFTISERHTWEERPEFQQGLRRILAAHASRITALIVGHDHIASLLSISGVPMIVSGATHESIPTRPRLFKEAGFEVSTKWLFREGAHWVRLDIDANVPNVSINFVHAGSNSVVCSARIAPRPVLMQENCARTTSRQAPVRTP